IVLPFVLDAIALYIIETKNYFDTIAEVVSSEEIIGCQTEQQRQNQAQCYCTSGVLEADGLSKGQKRLCRRSHRATRMWWVPTIPQNMQWLTMQERLKTVRERDCRRE